MKKGAILDLDITSLSYGGLGVAHYDDIVVFTEVNTQIKGPGSNEPRAQIEEYKSERIMPAAHHYIDQNELDVEIRFDVAEVILGNGKPKIDIIKNEMSTY